MSSRMRKREVLFNAFMIAGLGSEDWLILKQNYEKFIGLCHLDLYISHFNINKIRQ